MPDADIPADRVVDPVGLLNDPERPGRDGARTPMPWTAEPGAGFTRAGCRALAARSATSPGCNVAEQQRTTRTRCCS